MKQFVRSAKTLGAAIRWQRELKKLTQKNAGRHFKIAQSTLSEIENGNPNARIGTIFRVLAALDLELVVRSKEIKDPFEME